jgi:hypothetical protein
VEASPVEDSSAENTDAPWIASSRGSTYYRNGCAAGVSAVAGQPHVLRVGGGGTPCGLWAVAVSRMLRAAARCLLILGLAAETAGAQARCEESAAAREDAYCYARALIASLERAHRGAIAPDTTTLGRSAVEAAAEVMYVSRMKEWAVREAGDILAAYTASRVEEIRTSTEAMVAAYEVLAQIDSALRISLRDQLDSGGGSATGSGAEQMADYRFKRRLAAEGMMAAVGAAAQALVERGPNGNTTRLRITRCSSSAPPVRGSRPGCWFSVR